MSLSISRRSRRSRSDENPLKLRVVEERWSDSQRELSVNQSTLCMAGLAEFGIEGPSN